MKSLARTSLGLLPFQLVVRAAEASLPIFLAAWFGRSRATDAFTLLWSIFALAGALVFSAFQDSAIVPVFLGSRDRSRFVGAVLGHTLIAGGVVALLVAVGAAIAVRATTGSLWLSMVAAFALHLIATSVRTLHAALLNAGERYRAAPLASCAGGLVTLGLCALLRDPMGVAVVPLALLIGETVAAGLLVYAAGYVRPSLERPRELLEVGRLLASELAGNVIARANPVVDQLVATATGIVGGATLLRYAGDLALLPTSLLQAALLSVLLSRLSVVSGDRKVVAATVRRTLAVVVPLLAALAGLLALVRRPLFALVFAHGAMPESAAAQMADLAPAFLVGVPAFGALLVLARAHVALKNSRILPRVGLLSAALNLILDLLLVGPLGLAGVALATSITSLVVAIVFGLLLWRRLCA